jgi:hypothetical protein
MKLIYTKRYERAYRKLTQAQRDQADEAIREFEKDHRLQFCGIMLSRES